MYRSANSQFSLPLTPMVKKLLILNVGIWFFLQVILEGMFKVPAVSPWLALRPSDVIFNFSVWQIFTYMFLHSTGQIMHILFNMLMLWFFGSELEERWGSKKFLAYYLSCGAGAAVIYIVGVAIYSLITGTQLSLNIPVIGASGAIFGLLLAQAILFGERIVHFFMIFPMKTKYFVLLMGAIQMASMMTTGFAGGEVAYLAHLGGIAAGYLYLLGWSSISKYQKQKKSRKKNSNLRLVVDNRDEKKGSKDPKYWN